MGGFGRLIYLFGGEEIYGGNPLFIVYLMTLEGQSSTFTMDDPDAVYALIETIVKGEAHSMVKVLNRASGQLFFHIRVADGQWMTITY
jgi:hypothetical protein